jgi:hypothetical protein
VTWEPINLRHIGDRPNVRPTLCGLVYPGQRHLFSGPPESAKTLAAYAIGLEDVRAGGTVALVDFEMGLWDARDRLREMGATDDDLDRILYIEPETPADESTALDIIDRFAPTLSIIDATAGAFRLQGLDDNKRDDVEKFAAVLVTPFFNRGVTSLLLDHVVKNADNRNGFPIGSERKQGICQVHVGFDAVTRLSRGGQGLYKLRVHKDRSGWLRRPTWGELELRSDPATHAIASEFKPATEADSETSAEFRPTHLMERVSRFLELQSEPVSQTATETSVTGHTRWVRVAIDCLVREGWVSETTGKRNARLLLSVQAFREDDPVPTPSLFDDRDPVPTPSIEKPRGQAESRPRPDPVLTPSPVPGSTPSTSTLSPTGERDVRDGVVENGKRPLIGDKMYPVSLADAAQAGHLTQAEFDQQLALHRRAEMGARERRRQLREQLDARSAEFDNDPELAP